MAGWLVRTALRSSLNQVRHVRPVPPRRATGLTAAVYRQVERDFGMLAPPVALHSPSPAVLAAAWSMLREALVTTTPVRRAVKEAVATGVSRANSCPYCVEVHSAVLGTLPVEHATAAVTEWASGGGSRAGTTTDSVGRAGRVLTAPRPFPDRDAAELIAVAVTFHYLNRVVNVFLGDSPLPPGVPAAARERAGRFVGRVMRAPALRGGEASASATLLPAAPLPADLAWAAGEEHLAAAFARAASAVDTAIDTGIDSAVPASVRDLVVAELADWDGEPPGMSRAWLDGPVSSVPSQDRPAARLALLVAKASYQVEDDVVAAYRRDRPADAALVELVSWAALVAARRAGVRLAGDGTGRPGLGEVG
ncbi:carboxymuconolactone decarboxylase family protein [Actinophytocola gossypii]|uniref:Carboxymuconolactone decarboxylase family protein n=1 Tax=Actinophytocola gossypii TaxID=2812003 RepID=A0ABT2J7B1_9PSEU|nr:carboxymuconolactone decarboxylase family protein [Actinophytocola gossypii]MCT2583747.1 carboxymuconolactone decarboxylase family protein [Actinophytocola gossypii]